MSKHYTQMPESLEKLEKILNDGVEYHFHCNVSPDGDEGDHYKLYKDLPNRYWLMPDSQERDETGIYETLDDAILDILGKVGALYKP